MKIFACQFRGVWLGGHAVVIASSAERAAELVNEEAIKELGCHAPGLPRCEAKGCRQLPSSLTNEYVLITYNGDY